MMRRFVALLLAFGGLGAAASSASAQAISPLPSGVVLRVHGNNSTITGVLFEQSVDSVFVRPLAEQTAVQGMAASQITRVEQGKPAYARSVLIGTGLGLLLGAVLHPITAPRDRDLAIGFSVIAGAAAGLVFPRTDWVPVPLH